MDRKKGTRVYLSGSQKRKRKQDELAQKEASKLRKISFFMRPRQEMGKAVLLLYYKAGESAI